MAGWACRPKGVRVAAACCWSSGRDPPIPETTSATRRMRGPPTLLFMCSTVSDQPPPPKFSRHESFRYKWPADSLNSYDGGRTKKHEGCRNTLTWAEEGVNQPLFSVKGPISLVSRSITSFNRWNPVLVLWNPIEFQKSSFCLYLSSFSVLLGSSSPITYTLFHTEIGLAISEIAVRGESLIHDVVNWSFLSNNSVLVLWNPFGYQRGSFSLISQPD